MDSDSDLVSDDDGAYEECAESHGDDLIGKRFWEPDEEEWCEIVGKAVDHWGNRYLKYTLGGEVESSSVDEVREWLEQSPPEEPDSGLN